MEKTRKHWRSFVVSISIIGLLAVIPVGALACNPPQRIVLPNQTEFGMTSGDWAAAWWQWALTFTNTNNPVLELTGEKCGSGQGDGPVFFLAGAGTTDPVTRTKCIVPFGKAIVFPILSGECSNVELPPFYGSNERELRVCVAKIIDGVDLSTLKVTIDGIRVHGLKAFRAQSPVFGFTVPSEDNYFGMPGVTSGMSVADGYWVMVEPLSPGKHTIHFEAAMTSPPAPFSFSQNVTYHLTVAK